MDAVFPTRDAWLSAYRERWLAHYQATSQIDWKLYPALKLDSSPSGVAIDVTQANLLMVTSAGGYIPSIHSAFDAANNLGDYSIRLIDTQYQPSDYHFAHDHYDHTAVDADPQVLVPVQHLLEMQDAGLIGELAPQVVSFMGYQPDLGQVVDEMIPEIVRVARDLRVDAAFLVPS
jgi:glycine/betaine/sarcosine/D-proline reductase family selenoprotein B